MNKDNISIKILTNENYTVSHFNFIANIFVKEKNHNLQDIHDQIFPSKIDNCLKVIITEAIQNNKLIAGCVSYIWNRSNLYIAYFAVDPEHRDKKLGAQMLKNLRKYILGLSTDIKSIYLYVNIENFNAIGLYIKQGFIIEEYNANVGYYLMRKIL